MLTITTASLKEILFAFGRHMSPHTSDEDIEQAAEEYLEANEDKLLDYEIFGEEGE
jgi:hypothetical protein